MPVQNLHSQLRNSSHTLDLKMGALDLDTVDVSSDIYHILGLNEVGKKVLGPPRFLSLLSLLLQRSVQKNETLIEETNIKDFQTIFHGLRAPAVSIQQYVDRIFKYAGCSPSCFIVAYIYVDRYLQHTGSLLTSFNVHRLLITSVMLAAKFTDDAFCNNAYYAKVGGVSTSEMNRLEIKFLNSIDFRLRVDVETFQKYCSKLQNESRECQVDRAIDVCGVKECWQSKDESTCTAAVAR